MNDQPSETIDTLPAITTVESLHPGQIRLGDFVAPQTVSYQYPTYLCRDVDSSTMPADKPVRISFLPFDAAAPMKVVATCLPFVLCKTEGRNHVMIDLRQTQLVRVDARFAKKARKLLSVKSSSHQEKPKKKKTKKRKKK